LLRRLQGTVPWTDQNSTPAPNILIGSLKNINTEGHEPPPQYLSWMRALRISHPLVRDQLIINQFIEQTVLIEDRTEALGAMASRIPNVKSILCFFDDQTKHRGAGHRLVQGAFSPINAWDRPQRMRADIADKLK
jgi:hypothetical protein